LELDHPVDNKDLIIGGNWNKVTGAIVKKLTCDELDCIYW
jgi:hypothetical protein